LRRKWVDGLQIANKVLLLAFVFFPGKLQGYAPVAWPPARLCSGTALTEMLHEYAQDQETLHLYALSGLHAVKSETKVSVA
jgi:hypothetical protein